jgi:hypothetical protein
MMFLIQRNIDMEIVKEPLWEDNSPPKARPSPLLLSLLSKVQLCGTMGIPYPTLEHPSWPT